AQLPGRLWILRGGRTLSASTLTVAPLLLKSAGLALAAWAPVLSIAALAIALFGAGAGLHTLARPWLVQQRFGIDAGYRNGQIARVQGFGRAAGPVLAVTAASASSTTVVLSFLSVAMLMLIPLARRISREPLPSSFEASRDVTSAAIR
ncbi:MAG: hypothetical protein LC715_03440, partial [Gammaproteobacteria bacterium]|nr:hypothetical protein [Gammaproteobacteria bacterium]